MTDNLEQIIDAFKRRHPETKHWDDDEIVEAMFFILVKQTYSVFPWQDIKQTTGGLCHYFENSDPTTPESTLGP